MNELQNAIYFYAQEHLIPRFEALRAEELSEIGEEVRRAREELGRLGEEAKRTGGRLCLELESRCAFEKEAAFLAGLASGLELSRL